MYKLHNDYSVIIEAKKWCLVEATDYVAATVIAKIILSKYNSKAFPCAIPLHYLVHALDKKRLQLAIGVLLYSDDSIGEWSEMEELKRRYLID